MKWTGLVLLTFCAIQVATAEISKQTIAEYAGAVSEARATDVLSASKALATEAIANQEDPQAVVLAFEAAWSLCSLGKCADAIPAADFVVSQAITNPGAHPVHEDRNLLAAYAAWRVKGNSASRKRLDDALADMSGVEPSLLSLRAFADRYRVDQAGSDRKLTKQTARAAREHMEQIGDLIPDQLAVVNLVEAVSAWGGGIRASDQLRMEHARWQFQILLADERYNKAPGLADLRWRAQAWSNAMRSFVFARARGATPNKRTAGKFPGMSPEEAQEVAALYAPKLLTLRQQPEKRRCVGALNKQPDRTPRGRDQIDGYIGSVIVGADVEDGTLTNIRILAAVPDDKYTQFAIDAVTGLEWEKADEQPVEDCASSFTELVVPFNFSFQ